LLVDHEVPLTTYLVQPRDTLSGIAQRLLHDSNRWPEIARSNRLLNPNQLYLGQSLTIPGPATTASPRLGPSLVLDQPIPASVALARGFMFIIFEQLPGIGAHKVIRKVAAIPRDFSLVPQSPLGTLSLAEHVLNTNPGASPFWSITRPLLPSLCAAGAG
jgi:hypothetical protein